MGLAPGLQNCMGVPGRDDAMTVRRMRVAAGRKGGAKEAGREWPDGAPVAASVGGRRPGPRPALANQEAACAGTSPYQRQVESGTSSPASSSFRPA